MSLSPIIRRKFEEQDRTDLQEIIIKRTERNFDSLLKQYEKASFSFDGRYICSDSFKELFPEYAKSKEARARYNAVVHNSAAVLADEQFKRVTKDPMCQGDIVMFLTGIPGAGKTSSIIIGEKQFPDGFRAIYEGQLSRPEAAISKIQAVLDAGLKPEILVVHTPPERALKNTFKRFEKTGRGASIGLMADIQGNLPLGLAAIRERFGDAIDLKIVDKTDMENPIRREGWEHLPILQKEGNHEQIRQHLTKILENARKTGRISNACYEQANGRVSRVVSRDISLVRQSGGRT